MRKRSGVSKTGPVALPLVLLLCAAAPQMRRSFPELSPKNFWVVPGSTHVASGVACSGPLMACGRRWVPPGIGLLDAFCYGGVWPAAGGKCVAGMEGWWRSLRWYGAAPRWCGWLSVWAGDLGGCLRRGSRGVTFFESLLRPGRRIASQCLSAWTNRIA
jgi:hypothetical protein